MTVPAFLPSAALYRIEEIRQIEAAAIAGRPEASLMRAAGCAAADLVKKLIPAQNNKILVLAGPGNNGGDALEVAHLLAESGYEVKAILCCGTAQYSDDAKQSLQRAQASKVDFIDTDYLSTSDDAHWGLIVDGIFGIGLARAVTGVVASLIQQINQLSQKYRCPVLALDVPSGLSADTGQLIGDGIAIIATHTITFIGDKPGLHTAAGRDYCGQIECASLEIPANFFPAPSAYLSHPVMFSGALRPRLHDSHKGSNGDVLIIGGATGMAGALILAARAAIHCGAGRVYLGFLGPAPLFDGQHPELMCRAASDCDMSRSVVVIGPGLGDSAEAKQLLSRALNEALAMVIDADALNLIAKNPVLQALLAKRGARNVTTILTPHPLEAARLLETSAKEIQADRWISALNLAKKFQACVILKGAGSIIATNKEPICLNTTGNPALATAGTGDVLAGICGALLAQQVYQTTAARLAVWLHGLAADNLVEQGFGSVGLTASELIPAVRTCLNKFILDSNAGLNIESK